MSPTVEFGYSRRSILAFVLTVVGAWLSDPLLSLIDSTAVGRSNPLSLASLAPATMLIDSCIFLCWFLGMSTTNLLASTSPPPSKGTPSTPAHRKIIKTALGTAGLMGLLITLVMVFKATALLTWIAGPKNLAVVPEALGYVQIRGLGAPLAVVGMVCQAVCLASLDTRTPALAVCLSALINIILDFVLCIRPFRLGVAGAAVATALSNAAASALLLGAVYKRNFKSEEGGRGAKARAKRFTRMLELPSWKDFVALVKFAGAIFGIIIGKLVCYSSLTLAATRFGVTALAAHNVLLKIFFFFGTFGDSLSQSVQNFLPTVYTADPDPVSRSFKKFEKFLLLLGMACSVFFSVAAGGLTGSRSLAGLFTTDGPILSLMTSSSPFLCLSLILHPFVMLLEGSIIARRDTTFLLGSYGATFGLLWWQMRKATSLTSVWEGFTLFQLFRLAQFGVRYAMERSRPVDLSVET